MPPSMETLQITFKVKKGRRSVVAVVGRGSRRIEMGTGLRVPDGAQFEAPRNIVGGHHRARNDFIAALNDWESSTREKWRRITLIKPATVPSELLTFGKPTENPKPEWANELTLLGWIRHLTEQLDNGIICNERTGHLLSPRTLEFNRYYVKVISRFIQCHGDFDFGPYLGIDLSSRPASHDDFRALGSKIKRYIIEEENLGQETTFKLMERLRWHIRSSVKDLGLSLDPQLLVSFRYPRPRKNGGEDVIALDIDQFEWTIRNEGALRAEFPKPNHQVAIDYLIVGLMTCARKGDMNSWTSANLRTRGDETSLRYIPTKTKSSSGALVDITPLPNRVCQIFRRNLGVYQKLMPPLPTSLGRHIRAILRQQAIFNREVTVRLASGSHTKKKTWEALKVHSLRCSGITYLLSRGIPDPIVRSISGHTINSDSFGVYLKILESVKKEGLERLHSTLQ
jgi:hypothetical protein